MKTDVFAYTSDLQPLEKAKLPWITQNALR